MGCQEAGAQGLDRAGTLGSMQLDPVVHAPDHRGGELFLFGWISTLGLGGCVLLFCLDKGAAAAAAVTAAMTSVLGMLGWRQARPPQG